MVATLLPSQFEPVHQCFDLSLTDILMKPTNDDIVVRIPNAQM
jgi:hypothetical protein